MIRFQNEANESVGSLSLCVSSSFLSMSPLPSAAVPKFKEPESEGPRRKILRLHSGEHADHLDRFSCTYQERNFSGTFHSDAPDWRECDTCGKGIHCGRMELAPTYMLLDGGGIQCIVCATKALDMGMISGPCSFGVNYDEHPNSCVKPLPSSILKEDSSSLLGVTASFSASSIFRGHSSSSLGMTAPFSVSNGAEDPARVSTTLTLGPMAPSSKEFPSNNPQNMGDFFGEMNNGRSRLDDQPRAHSLPCYWPEKIGQELQKISGYSNSVMTPLFEKMLCASDAGEIGFFVLPKRFAEAYFPEISQSEGLPLNVQDASGKEWVFQFRFWLSDSRRIYFLEGFTPFLRSMQLQVGDTVTFSRIDPEGKLVMGFRKAPPISTEQDTQTPKAGYKVNKNAADFVASVPPWSHEGSPESGNPGNTADPATWSKHDEAGFIQKDRSGAPSSQRPREREGDTLGSKSKRICIESDDSIELKLTLKRGVNRVKICMGRGSRTSAATP